MVKDSEIKKQVEYYFSDQNLKTDSFFHGLISADKEVWAYFIPGVHLDWYCAEMQQDQETKGIRGRYCQGF